MANLTNCTGGAAAALIPFDPLSLCNPDGSDSLIGLPCSSSIVGNIFLIAVYGILLGMGAKWISEGSDLLLEVWGPGLVGGLLLPTLGALPDALVIAMSVIQSTDPAKLQDDLNVGMGTLVGSNVVLLTIPWSMALAYGKVPMDRRSGGTLSAQYKKFHNNQGLFLQDQGGETTTPAKTETKTKTIAASSASSSGSPGIASNEQNSLPSVSSSSSSSSSSDSSSSSGSSSSSDEEHRENYLIGDDTFQMPTMGAKTQRSMLRRRKRRRNRKKARRDGRPRPSRTKRTTPKTTATITTTNNITTLPIISEDVEAEHSQHDADDESEEEDEQEEKEDAVQVVVEMTENKQDEELLDINALKTGGDEDAAAAAAASTPWWKRHDFWCMTGVTIQSETKLNAIFMMGSLLPLVVVQGVAFAGNKEATRIGAIVAVFCCVLTFIWYSYYTIRDPIVQATKRKMIIKKYNGLRFVESIKKRFESGYQETKEGDLGGVGSENDPLLQASDRQYLASRYSVTSRNLNVRRHRGGENGMGVGGGGSGGGSSSSSSHRGSLGGHGLRQRTLARRKSGFNTTVDQLFRDFKKNDPIKRALHIQKKQQKQDKIQTYQDAIVERFEESSIQAPKNTSVTTSTTTTTTTTTTTSTNSSTKAMASSKNDDNTIIMKRQGTLDVLFGRGEEEQQQQQQKKTETNKDVANAVKNEETKVESTAITTKAEETVTVAVNSKNKNKNNKIMRRLQSENMLSTNQQSATSDSNKQKTRTNSGIVYDRSRRRRSSSNSCNPRPFISQSLEASLLNQKDVKQAKKNGAAKSTVNALANISLFNLRMVRNMDDIRKEFHQAKDTAVKLSKIGDGKKVEQGTHAYTSSIGTFILTHCLACFFFILTSL